MNKDRLQNYNERLSNNNDSLITIKEHINNLPTIHTPTQLEVMPSKEDQTFSGLYDNVVVKAEEPRGLDPFNLEQIIKDNLKPGYDCVAGMLLDLTMYNSLQVHISRDTLGIGSTFENSSNIIFKFSDGTECPISDFPYSGTQIEHDIDFSPYYKINEEGHKIIWLLIYFKDYTYKFFFNSATTGTLTAQGVIIKVASYGYQGDKESGINGYPFVNFTPYVREISGCNNSYTVSPSDHTEKWYDVVMPEGVTFSLTNQPGILEIKNIDFNNNEWNFSHNSHRGEGCKKLRQIRNIKNLRYTCSFKNSVGLDGDSARALFNGLSVLPEDASETLSLHAATLAKVTPEDILIATNKGWIVS